MKWITSTDIKQWADTRDAQSLLPELVLRLIRATSSSIKKIRFPSGDAVYLTGLDGMLESDETVFNVSAGLSLWECGTDANSKEKANKDYGKREANVLATFVFVTPRIWNGAVEWSEIKKKEGRWKDVVVLTAVELEDWLSMCPSVALWFAETISRKTIIKVYDLETYWNRWASGEDFQLRPTILLGGREEGQEIINKSITSPSVTIVQSKDQSESLAFTVACILENSNKDDYLSKCLVVEDENTLERLIDKYKNLILITNVENKNHIYAIQNGHCIIYAASAAETFSNESKERLLKLPILNREKFITSLVESGINKTRAEQLSRETARNITILRRKLGLDNNSPEWAKSKNIRDLIPAILVGRWSNSMEGDEEIVSLIAGETYESYSIKLKRWVHVDDSPIVEVDGKWRIYSPYEAFQYAAKYITSADWNNYKEAISRITLDNDPDAYEKMTSSRFRFWKHKQRCSGWIKEGLFQTAMLISLMDGEQSLNIPMLPSEWIDDIVQEILNNSSIEWWFSNKSVLNLVAEASPKSYIAFIQNDIVKEVSIIKQLFVSKDATDLFDSQGNYSQVLHSLQLLSWSEKWLLPISCIFAELNNINIKSCPIESLYETFAIWMPQTYAGTKQRLQVLETLSKKYPGQVFNLFYKLLDRLDSATLFCTNPMRWRCYNDTKSNITLEEIHDSAHRICELMVSICDNSEEQICKIIDLASQAPLGSENRCILFNHVDNHKDAFAGSYVVTNVIREIIYHHKTYSETKWALPSSEIQKWEVLLPTLESNCLLERYRWMFKKNHVEILGIDRRRYSFEETITQTNEFLNNATKEVEQVYGFRGICEFAKKVECPIRLGEVYAYSADEDNYIQVLDTLLVENDDSIVSFAKGFFSCYTNQNGIDNVVSIIKSKDLEKYKSVIIIPLTIAPCSCREMWTFIETLPQLLQDEYWTNICINHICYDESIFLIEKLIKYQRYANAISTIFYSSESTIIPTNLIEETIMGFISSANEINTLGMQYELAKIVYILDKREDVNVQTLYFIELVLYKWLSSHGDVEETKFVDEIISNPQSMMVIIDNAYLSEEESERVIELEQRSNNPTYMSLCMYILTNIRRMPCVDKNNIIDSDKLNKYIAQLQEFGEVKHKIKCVNTVIGELLGNYPETKDYPPIEICDIIDNQNNTDINDGFYTKLFNKRGVTVRAPFDGGTLERNESRKYKEYADAVRYTHPVTCRIFDNLSKEYQKMAQREDVQVEIEKMEY